MCQQIQPCAQWIGEVDLALQDENQQCGNLDEAAGYCSHAAKVLGCLAWNHRQSPESLHKSDATRRFGQKLLRRPIALRGDSHKVQHTAQSGVQVLDWNTMLSPRYATVASDGQGFVGVLQKLVCWYCSTDCTCCSLVGHAPRRCRQYGHFHTR